MDSPRNTEADGEGKARRSRRPDQSRTTPRIGQDRRGWRNGFGSIAGLFLSPACQERVEREGKMGKEGGHVLKAARLGCIQGGPPPRFVRWKTQKGGVEEAGNWRRRSKKARRMDATESPG